MKKTLDTSGLPANLDTEKLLLAACLRGADNFTDILDAVEPADFMLAAHRMIYMAIQELARLKFAIDRVTVTEQLMATGQLDQVGGLSFLIDLDQNWPTVVNPKEYIRIVKEKARKRKLVYLAQEVGRSALDDTVSSDDVLNKIDTRVYTLFRAEERGALMKMSDFIAEKGVNVLLQPASTLKGKGLHTGFRRLDELTDGFHGGEIFIFGGSPGMGKTAVALQIAAHVAGGGRGVAFFSLEMSKENLHARLICELARVPVMRFRSGQTNADEDQLLQEANTTVNEWPLFIDDTPALTADEIGLRLRRLQAKHDIGLAIIDYVQLVQSSNSRHSENERLSEISKTMKTLAKEQAPLLVLSQLSRDHKRMKQKPDLNDLRGSGTLEAVAQVVVFPWREDIGPNARPETRGKASFLLRKNRDGKTEEIKMRYINWRMRYEEPEEEDAVSPSDY